jgi:hypothetical protein
LICHLHLNHDNMCPCDTKKGFFFCNYFVWASWSTPICIVVTQKKTIDLFCNYFVWVGWSTPWPAGLTIGRFVDSVARNNRRWFLAMCDIPFELRKTLLFMCAMPLSKLSLMLIQHRSNQTHIPHFMEHCIFIKHTHVFY